MTVSSPDRQIEIEDLISLPIYDHAKALKTSLGYEPLIYPIGRSAPEELDDNRVTISLDFDVSNRGPDGISGFMFQTEATFSVTYEVPDYNEVRNTHDIIKRAISSLQNYYSLDFCQDVEQLYFDDISWTTSIDSTSTTEYVLSIDLRFREYPTSEAS